MLICFICLQLLLIVLFTNLHVMHLADMYKLDLFLNMRENVNLILKGCIILCINSIVI